MISAHDFVHLPFSSDLTPAGIAACRRALPWMRGLRGTRGLGHLKQAVAGVVLDLAFRRYLSRQEIPFRTVRHPSFASPEQYALILGRHRCDVIPLLISGRREAAALQADVGSLLRAQAPIPADQSREGGRLQNGIYVFALLSAASPDSNRHATASQARTPAFYVHVLPAAWASPSSWTPLAPLALKSESDSALQVELAGQDEHGEFMTRSVTMPPRRRLEVGTPFYTLTHLHADRCPSGRIAVRATHPSVPHVAEPGEWGDIWIRGEAIVLLGWLGHSELRQRARGRTQGSRVFRFGWTRGSNLAVSISELRPLDRLLELARREPAIA